MASRLHLYESGTMLPPAILFSVICWSRDLRVLFYGQYEQYAIKLRTIFVQFMFSFLSDMKSVKGHRRSAQNDIFQLLIDNTDALIDLRQ